MSEARTVPRPRIGFALVGAAAFCAMAWMALMVVLALGSDHLALYDYTAIDLRNRLRPPVWIDGGAWRNPLGTDDLGRDLYSRLLQSVRTSVSIAIVATLIGAIIGTTLGFVAAHFGGLVDEMVVMAIDYQAALPFMVLVLAVLAFFGNSLILFICVMGFYGWERYARITRGMTLAALGQGYAVSLKVLGASPARIYLRHILPNIAGALLVCLTLTFPQVIMLETSLSFLGLGVQAPQSSLGNMVGNGRDYIMTAWWMSVLPALVIFVTTLAVSTFGDWLADYLDPTLGD